MTNQKDRETASLQQALKDVTPQKDSLDLDKAINELDLGLSLFQNGEAIGLGLYCMVVEGWRIVNENRVLKKRAEEKMEVIREDPKKMAEYGVPTDVRGDPVTQFFNPNCWAGRMTEGREEDFVLERIEPLRKFFVSLSPKEQPKPIGQQG